MHHIPPPDIDDTLMLEVIIQSKRGQRKHRLARIKPQVLDEYQKYITHAPNLEALPVATLKALQQKALIHAYESPTTPMNRMRSILMDRIITSRCPMCGIGETSTLDHYLPKEHHPSFSVFSKNLVPCCSACNTRKSELLLDKGTGIRMFLHPYYDKVPKLRFISLEIDLQATAIGLKFGIKKPSQMDGTVFTHLQFHFDKLNLADRYRRMSLNQLRDLRDSFVRNYGTSRNASRVASELIQFADDIERNYGPNHWRSVLYRTLGADAAFCDGGFQVLNAIQ